MGILQRSIEGRLQFFEVEEGKRSSCRIPAFPNMRMDIFVRCAYAVDLNVVMDDGQIMLLESGKIVRWSGRMIAGAIAVEIVSDTGFWYLCQKSPLFEFNDGIPLKVEIVQTEADVLRMMIDDRLRAYKAHAQLEREFTEEEWEEAVLDIATGDLEFEEAPDPFGLGYEERLKEFIERHGEQKTEAVAEAADSVPAGSSVAADTLPAGGSNSSST